MYQLYKASKSERIRIKRRNSRLVNPVLFLVLALLALSFSHYIFAALMLIAVPLWYFLYPVYEAGYYLRHYQAFIKENFGKKQEEECLVQFDNDVIHIADAGTTMKLATSQLDAVHETGHAVYVFLKSGGGLILPKNKIAEMDNLTAWLRQLAAHLQIPYTTEPGWKWA